MIELDVADMIMVIITLAICVVLLTIKMFKNETRLNRLEGNDDALETAIEGLTDRCDTHKKSIEYLSKSVRELNGVVEEAVKVKEETSDNKPDTKALIGGWTTDDGLAEIDASHISTGTIMMWHGRFVNERGRLADGTVVWGDKDGRLYVGDAKPYEMDQ